MEYQLVTFRLAEEEFGVDILKVQEINRMVDITPVPRMPPYVEGVINLRGKVIPVINLRRRFGMPEKEHDTGTRVVVVDLEGVTFGLLVDSVSEVLRMSSDTVEPPPPVMDGGMDSEYISAVGRLGNRLVALLELDKVFDLDTALGLA